MALFDNLIFALKILTVLGSGLIAGTFFAFSSFVMTALSRLPTSQGIAAMQSINIVVINPVFMTAFLGTAAACLVLTVFSFFRWQQPDGVYLLAGSLLYLIGTFLVTIVFNVPLNEALAKAAADSAEGADLWKNYLINWTFWNHIRTIAALASMIFIIFAVYFSNSR